MRRSWLGIVIAIGTAASLGILAARWSAEAAYRAVEIVLDGPDWETLAAREGKSPLAFLEEARVRGATAVAVYERTLKRMAEHGELAYASTSDLMTLARLGTLPPVFRDLVAGGSVHPLAVYIASSAEMVGMLEDAYRSVLGSSRVRRIESVLEVTGTREELEELGIGYLPADLVPYIRTGLRPVLRVRNVPGLTADGLRYKVSTMSRLGRGFPIVFELTEVLGFERLVDETAGALRAAGLPYGRIEVFNVKRKQRGEEELGERMRPDVIRLFSLTPDELLMLSPASVEDKFVRAARERNIRLLYVRPLQPTAGVVGTEANLRLLSEMAADLRRLGYRLGGATPLPDLHVSPLLFWAAAAGAVAGMVLALAALGSAVGASVPDPWLWILLLGGVLSSAGMLVAGPWMLWRKLLALGTACAVPGLAIMYGMPRGQSHGPTVQAMRTLWLASALSAVAGVLVASLLTDWEFMMAEETFLGVKVAQIVPAVAVVLLLAWRDRPAQRWRQTLSDIWSWTARPLLLRYAIAVIIVGVAAVILLARSGNFGLPLLAAEERLRNLMEDLLVARPRTKEYLIGHPALMLAAAVAALGWRAWALLLAAIGAIGQAGIVNSFSHIHTPLVYVVWRTINALVLGSVLGVIAVVLLTWVARRGPRHRSPF